LKAKLGYLEVVVSPPYTHYMKQFIEVVTAKQFLMPTSN